MFFIQTNVIISCNIPCLGYLIFELHFDFACNLFAGDYNYFDLLTGTSPTRF